MTNLCVDLDALFVFCFLVACFVSVFHWLAWIVGWWWLRQRGVNVSTICNVRIPARVALWGACWADEYSVEKFVRDVLCVGRWLTTVFVVGVG